MISSAMDIKVGDTVIVMRIIPEKDTDTYSKTMLSSLKKDQADFFRFYMGRIGEVFDVDSDPDFPIVIKFFIRKQGEVNKRYYRFRREEIEPFRAK